MSKARVLIIDDDPMVTQLLHEHLTNEGFDVAEVHLAQDGFDLAVKSPPELIMLDVMLPDATGFQMLGRLRQNPNTKSIPIIMMSGTARNANQLDIGKNMGANAYVVKPFNVIEVGEQIHNLIKSHPQQKPMPAAPMLELQEVPEVPTHEESAPADVPFEEMPIRRTPAPVPEEEIIELPVARSTAPAPVQAPASSWKITWKMILIALVVQLAWAVLVGYIVAWVLTSRGVLRPFPPTSPNSHQKRF